MVDRRSACKLFQTERQAVWLGRQPLSRSHATCPRDSSCFPLRLPPPIVAQTSAPPLQQEFMHTIQFIAKRAVCPASAIGSCTDSFSRGVRATRLAAVRLSCQRQQSTVVNMAHCSRDTPKLTPEEIRDGLKSRPMWVLTNEGTTISRAFVAKNWQAGAC